MKTQEILEFGPYRLVAAERLLLRNGEPVTLTPKVFDLLVILASNPGTLLKRESLLKSLWPDSFIEENNLTVNISTLRKVLAEGAGPMQFIETVPKLGYRFVADVRPVVPDPVADTVAAGPDTIPARSQRFRPAFAAAAGGAIVVAALAATGLLRLPPTEPAAMEALPLTSYPGSEYSPTIAPDGTRAAFTWQAPGDSTPGIYVKVIGPGEPVRLTPPAQAITDPAWAPDGTRLAAIRDKPEGGEEIVLLSAIGGAIRRLADILPEREFHGNLLEWSADGRWVLAGSSETPGAPGRIVAVSAETGQTKPITSPPATILGDSQPAISPDGRELVFSRNVTSIVADYYVLDLSGPDLTPKGPPRRLTSFENQAGGAAWLLDGREIVLSAGPPLGGLRLFRIPVDRTTKAGSLQPIPYIGIDGRSPAISRPSGRIPSRLIYEKVSIRYSLWRLDMAGREGAERTTPWASSTRMDQAPDISPDGKRVAFASTRSGSWEIWTCDTAGLDCAQLTSFGRSFSRSPRWSPDGSEIAFDSRIAGNGDIYVIGARGGKPRQLTNEASNDIFPSWSADGRWIYFSSNRSGESRVWKVPAAGGAAIAVSQGAGAGPQESRDGAWVYFARRNVDPGIWRIPAGGGAEEKILPDVSFGLAYRIGKSGIYYTALAPDGGIVAYYDLASRKSSTLFRHALVDPNGLALASDERWLLFVQAAKPDSDLMLVDPFR